MNYLEQHQFILQSLKIENSQNIRQPRDSANLVNNLTQTTEVDGDTLAKILSELSGIPKIILCGDEIIKSVKQGYDNLKDKDSIIHDGVLYLVNPFDEQVKQNKLQLKQKGSITFSELGVIAYNHPALPKVAGKDGVKNDNDNNEILLLWQNILKEIQIIEPSDIHLIPENDFARVCLRHESNLIFIKDIEFKTYKRLANLLLGLAAINSSSFALPQQGKIIEEGIEFRFQSIQTNHLFDDGALVPKITLRAHYRDHNVLSLDSIGLNKYQKQILKNVAASVNVGAVLISGPTGSGKTTLLYSLLSVMQKLDPNKIIHTLEDPVEIDMPNIIQSPINKNAYMDYEDAIPVLLRSDIDVALISEIRNKATARKALEIALTGHIAFSTIHANDALSIIARLEESFGVARHLMANTLNTLISQRLVRKICKACSNIALMDKAEKYYPKYVEMGLDINTNVRHLNHNGCKHCRSGYSGRVPILEIMQLDIQAKKMISSGDDLFMIRDYLNNSTNNSTKDDYLNSSLMQAGINALLAGLISFEELERIPAGYFNVPQDITCS